MTGGLLQLVAYGENDIFLTGNPQITFFKTVYRKPTNFAIESIKHPYTSPIYPNGKITFNIAREGDLVSDIMLKMNGLTQDALAAIEYVECSIGGNVIDRQYGDWMNIWSDLSHNIDKTKLLNELRNGRGFIDVPIIIDLNQPLPIEMSTLQIDKVIDYPIYPVAAPGYFSKPINIVKHSSGQMFFTKTGGTQAKLATINLAGEVSEISVETGLPKLDYIGIMGNSIYSIAKGTSSGNISRLTLTANGDYDSMDALWIDGDNPPEVGLDKYTLPSIRAADGADIVGFKTGPLNDIKGNDNMLLIASTDATRGIVRVYDNASEAYVHQGKRLPIAKDIDTLFTSSADGAVLTDGNKGVSIFWRSQGAGTQIKPSPDGKFIYWGDNNGNSGLIRRLDLKADTGGSFNYKIQTVLRGAVPVGEEENDPTNARASGQGMDGVLGTSSMGNLRALCILHDIVYFLDLVFGSSGNWQSFRKIDISGNVFTVTTLIPNMGNAYATDMAIHPTGNYILYVTLTHSLIMKITLVAPYAVTLWFGDESQPDKRETGLGFKSKSILFNSAGNKLYVGNSEGEKYNPLPPSAGWSGVPTRGVYRVFNTDASGTKPNPTTVDVKLHGSFDNALGATGPTPPYWKVSRLLLHEEAGNDILYSCERNGVFPVPVRGGGGECRIRSHTLPSSGSSISKDFYNSVKDDGLMGYPDAIIYKKGDTPDDMSYFYWFGESFLPVVGTPGTPGTRSKFQRLPVIVNVPFSPPYYLKQHTSALSNDAVPKIIETMALDSNDNIYICFTGADGLYKVLYGATQTNTVTTFIPGSNVIKGGSGIVIHKDGPIYISCKDTGKIFKYESEIFKHIAGDGTDAITNSVNPFLASFSQPTGLCISAYNDLMICDANGKLRVMERYNPSPGFRTDPIAVTSYVPLQFWFCRNPGLAIPLIALQYHDIKITVQFAKSLNGITDIEAWVDYFFIDTDERRRFSQMSHEYLIEQVQYSNKVHVSTPTITGGTPQEIISSVAMQFNQPVKELYWTINQENTGSEPTGTAQACSISNQGGTQAIQTKTAIMRFNNSDRFMSRDGKYFTKVQRYQHHSGAGINTTRLGVDSNDVSSELVTSKWYPKVANIHTYSFALHPEDHQPSGTCNFSRITSAFLDNTFDTPSVDGTYNYYINVYAVNYNVLRITDGMGGLLFTN
jgi:hypothetical protein